jgi:hypothetical protein
MSKFGWTYEDASNELDRIIKSTRSSVTLTPAQADTFHGTTASCSICGHTQHNPSSPDHEHHRHNHAHNTSASGMDRTRFTDSFRSEHTVQSRHSHGDSFDSHSHYTPASKQDKIQFDEYRTSSIKKGNDSYTSTAATPASPKKLSYRMSETKSTPKTPDSVLITEAKQSASSVIHAFRELQSKAKIIENERNAAMRIRDELRQELTETRRIQALSRSKQEMRTNDHYLSIKASTDELLVTHSSLHAQIRQMTEASSLLKDKLSNQYAKQNVVEDDIRRCDTEVHSAQHRITELKRELMASQSRVDSMEKRLDTDSAAEERQMQAEIQRVREANEKEKLAAVRADIRLGALQSYLEIILKVNGDLCEAIRDKEDTDNRAVRMAERVMESQLHTREREVNFILNKAESIGIHKAMEVSRSVNRFTSPYVMTSPSFSRRSSSSGNGHRHVTFKTAGGKRKTKTAGSKSKLRSKSVDSGLGPRIYDPSLIEAAARMAATAAATSVVAANSAAHCSACPSRAFIPSGSRTNKEFNVIASVSHAAREAKTLNARVASK